MATFWHHCPHCGEQHLMILGATIVHESGKIISKCPHEKGFMVPKSPTKGGRND